MRRFRARSSRPRKVRSARFRRSADYIIATSAARHRSPHFSFARRTRALSVRDLLTKRARTSRLLARLTRLFSKSRRHQPLLTSVQTAPPSGSSFRDGQVDRIDFSRRTIDSHLQSSFRRSSSFAQLAFQLGDPGIDRSGPLRLSQPRYQLERIDSHTLAERTPTNKKFVSNKDI